MRLDREQRLELYRRILKLYTDPVELEEYEDWYRVNNPGIIARDGIVSYGLCSAVDFLNKKGTPRANVYDLDELAELRELRDTYWWPKGDREKRVEVLTKAIEKAKE